MRPPKKMPPAIKGWVLYDGDCGFCSSWVPRWQGVLRRRGIAIAPLQSSWVGEKMQMPIEDLLTDMRLLFINGDNLKGADVYRYAFHHIWWAQPFWLLASIPPLRQIFNWGYRHFADNRYWISRTCHVPAKPKSFSVRPRDFK